MNKTENTDKNICGHEILRIRWSKQLKTTIYYKSKKRTRVGIDS